MEELIAEPFARARAFDQAGDIDKFNRGRHNFLRMRHFGELRQARIGHSNNANVGIDRAEGIIFGRRFVCARDRIEKRRFTDVWQPDDSGAQHKRGRYCKL